MQLTRIVLHAASPHPGWGIPLIIAVVAKITDQLDTSPSFAS